VEELELAQVLSITGDEVRFKHKYAYYYFVAQYFHDGMSDRKEAAAIVDKLKELANNAHSDDNAHILIFYLYMSKDRELIVHILENARKSYASLGMSDLDKDVEFANALFGPVVSMEAPSDDTDANRTEYRARRDSVADSEEAQHDAAAAQMQRELDFAFQSMNIMGLTCPPEISPVLM